MDKRIKGFAELVCDVLDIDMPKICVSDVGLTGTMLSACLSDGSEIHLRTDKVSPDLLFAIAHELRHVWQIRTGKARYFNDYVPRTLLKIEDYNLQYAEIDANAFGAVIMCAMFGIEPQFNGLDASAKREIKKQMAKIKSELEK